jgi:ankyrin repeat protein
MSLIDFSGIHISPVTDFYGNTPLHCAAAAFTSNEFWRGRVREMVAKGANVNIRNTSGETFLHILCRHPLKRNQDVLGLVSILKLVQNIPLFSISDYHGCTILHYLFRGLEHHQLGDKNYRLFGRDVSASSVRLISEIFEVIKPALWKQHFNTQDNAGNKVLGVLEDSCSKVGRKLFTEGMKRLMATIMKDITPPPSIVHYQSNLAGRVTIPGQITNEDFYGWLGNLTLVPGMTEKEATERPLEDIRLERRLTWIDDSGDTPLTALLKSPLAATIPADSLRKYVKCMLKFGSEIHIRDRNGDTALAIAARLGIHSVVTLLLEEGANVHSRDYLGVGILSQTERSMYLAAGDEKLWAMIWSCRITLIDAGAKEEPTDQDEWMLPLSTRLKLQEVQDVNGQLV